MSKSIFSEDLTITGDVSGTGSLEVSGRVQGDVQTQTVTIMKGGNIEGQVKVEAAMIEGQLKGAVSADSVDLAGTAVVEADVTAKSLSTQKGARVQGKINIG